MFLVLNSANLIVSVTDSIRYVAPGPGNLAVAVEREKAKAIFSAADDAFYPIDATPWSGGGHRVEEVESVPANVVPKFYYYSWGEFYTTPEREAALEDEEARQAAPAVASIAFVALAEAGSIDEVTAGEHADMFASWEPVVSYAVGNIRRHDGQLYKCIQAHVSQADWTPDAAVSLWTKIADQIGRAHV